MSKASDIRDRVMAMESTDCRQELADALELIDKLETAVTAILKVMSRETFASLEIKILAAQFDIG